MNEFLILLSRVYDCNMPFGLVGHIVNDSLHMGFPPGDNGDERPALAGTASYYLFTTLTPIKK